MLSSSAATSYGQQHRSSSSKSSSVPVPDPALTAQDKYDRFELWLRDNGAKFEMLELREYDCAASPTKLLSDLDHDDEEKKETTFHDSSEMRGVHAMMHIPPNTVCMSIPRRCLITVEMGQATPIGQAILHSDLDLDAPKHIFLMIYILWDRKVNGKNSFFAPYYDILPATLRNMPIFWSTTELRYLEGSYLLHQIHDRNQAITEDYEAICQIAPLTKIASLEEFKWARMCVCSRNFGLQIDGHRTSALVPHADMLNHYRPRETKWTFDEERQAFTITTLQHIPAHAQVYDSYGQKCNHRFLLNYGFAVEDNRELDGFCPNEVPIELYVDPEDELFSEKLDFWTRGEMQSSANWTESMLAATATSSSRRSRAGGAMKQQQFLSSSSSSFVRNPSPATPVVKRVRVCVSNNENTRLLFSLLRVLACNKDELSAISAPVPSDGVTRALFGLATDATASTRGTLSSAAMHHHHQSSSSSSSTTTTYQRSCRDIRHPISLSNEKLAMRLLLEVVGRHLRQYPTTLAQDIADLHDEVAWPRFSNKRHAKIQVRGEKEVLHHYAQWARTSLDVLEVIEEELREERQQRNHTTSASVEVKLTHGGRMVSVSASDEQQTTTTSSPSSRTTSFDTVIRRMEDDVDGVAGIQHTILRYCADVLGSLRREEFKSLRKSQRPATTAASLLASHHHRVQQADESKFRGSSSNSSNGRTFSYL